MNWNVRARSIQWTDAMRAHVARDDFDSAVDLPAARLSRGFSRARGRTNRGRA